MTYFRAQFSAQFSLFPLHSTSMFLIHTLVCSCGRSTAVHDSVVEDSAVQYSTYGALQYSTVQHGTVQQTAACCFAYSHAVTAVQGED